MINTHTHIYTEDFDNDRALAIERARSVGVETFVMPCVNMDSVARMRRLREEDPAHFCCAYGVHPEEITEEWRQELQEMKEIVFSEKEMCAVGEIGIDLHWNTTNKKEQETAFEEQLSWAKELGLGVIVHCRDAMDVTLGCIRNVGVEKGIMHCFSGGVEDARTVLGMGVWKLGIGGVVTFKNSGLGEVVKYVGVDYVVLETDDPWLAPVPYRGKRNEPSYMAIVVDKIADITQSTAHEVVKKTTKNAKEVLKILSLQS